MAGLEIRTLYIYVIQHHLSFEYHLASPLGSCSRYACTYLHVSHHYTLLARHALLLLDGSGASWNATLVTGVRAVDVPVRRLQRHGGAEL